MPEMKQTPALSGGLWAPILKKIYNNMVTKNLKSCNQKKLSWRRLNALKQINPPNEQKCQPTAQIIGKTVPWATFYLFSTLMLPCMSALPHGELLYTKTKCTCISHNGVHYCQPFFVTPSTLNHPKVWNTSCFITSVLVKTWKKWLRTCLPPAKRHAYPVTICHSAVF